MNQMKAAQRARKLVKQTISESMIGKRVSLEAALTSWKVWMRVVGRSEWTIQNGVTFVQAWIRDKKLGGKMPSEVTAQHVDKWVNEPNELTKGGSRAIKLSILRAFFDFCAAKNYVHRNPASMVRLKLDLLTPEQSLVKQKKAFTDAEIKKLLANTKGFWHAAVAFGRWAGLRFGEVCQLEWSSLKKKKLVIQNDRRNQSFEFPIPDQLSDAIAQIPVRDPQFLFPEERRKFSDIAKRSYFSVTFGRICNRLQLEGHTFNDLRHTYVTEARRKGIPTPHIPESLAERLQRTAPNAARSL